MKFVLTPPIEDYTIEHYRCAPWTIDVKAFAFSQYRVQIWWDGPKGREFHYPDMVLPNF